MMKFDDFLCLDYSKQSAWIENNFNACSPGQDQTNKATRIENMREHRFDWDTDKR